MCPASAPGANVAARAKAPNASCGISPNANPQQVSGACNCILASSTTITQTVTSGGPSFDTATVEVTSTFTEQVREHVQHLLSSN